MSWTCEQVEVRLSDYLDGHLRAEELQGFSGHLATCARCAPLVTQVSGVMARVHALAPVEPPPRLVHNILDQTLGPRHVTAAPTGMLGWVRLLMQPRFAMGAVTVVLALLFISQGLGIEWSKVEMADLKPVNLYRAADRRAHLFYARGVKFVNDLRVVYEIQTRLEPQPEPPAQQQQRAPGSTEGQPDPRRQRDLNRADELRFPSVLASGFPGAPGRSLR